MSRGRACSQRDPHTHTTHSQNIYTDQSLQRTPFPSTFLHTIGAEQKSKSNKPQNHRWRSGSDEGCERGSGWCTSRGWMCPWQRRLGGDGRAPAAAVAVAGGAGPGATIATGWRVWRVSSRARRCAGGSACDAHAGARKGSAAAQGGGGGGASRNGAPACGRLEHPCSRPRHWLTGTGTLGSSPQHKMAPDLSASLWQPAAQIIVIPSHTPLVYTAARAAAGPPTPVPSWPTCTLSSRARTPAPADGSLAPAARSAIMRLERALSVLCGSRLWSAARAHRPHAHFLLRRLLSWGVRYCLLSGVT